VASRFGPETLEYTTGGPIANQLVSVRLRGSLQLAELFSDETEVAGAANPVMTDADGVLVFFAAAGYYDLVFHDVEVPIVVGSPGGGEARAKTHIQSVAVTPWVITHGLSFQPAGVQIIESTGDPIVGAVDYPSPGLVRITFDAPTSGVAYLS
jgi:hypothetical protein